MYAGQIDCNPVLSHRCIEYIASTVTRNDHDYNHCDAICLVASWGVGCGTVSRLWVGVPLLMCRASWTKPLLSRRASWTEPLLSYATASKTTLTVFGIPECLQ